MTPTWPSDGLNCLRVVIESLTCIERVGDVARHTMTPGVIRLADSGADVRCRDVKPLRADQATDVGKWCGLASDAKVAGDLEPGQRLDAGPHQFTWSDIEWIHFGDPFTVSTDRTAGGGDRRAE
jgi:hypothetical protein